MTPLIHVDPKAAGRLGLLMGGGGGGAPKDSHPPARVHVLRDGEQLGGPNAIGRPGDLLLENGEVAFVIDQLGSSAGFAESGGNLVDAADARARQDELGEVLTYFGTFPRQGVYEELRSGQNPDGSAWVEASGKELYEPTLAVRTRYTLHPPDRALLLETTLENTGDAGVSVPSLGDAVQWGGAEKVVPGKPRGYKGSSSGPFLGGVGRLTSYALTSTEGTLDAVNGVAWSDTIQQREVALAPHARASFARVFAVGLHPDTASLLAELALASGQPTGVLAVSTGATPTGLRLGLRSAPGAEPLSLAYPYEAVLPPGSYTVLVPGGAPVGPVEVGAGANVTVPVALPAPSRLRLSCVDGGGQPMPCKLTLDGQGATPNPEFGPAHAAGPARNQVTSDGAVAVVAVSAGAYRITASRGPEYALDATDLTVATGEEKELRLSPRRVVDTSGYLGCDFHQHTMLGTDAPTSARDRVVANVAEGVDVAVASEHNVVADLSPLVRERHLEASLVALPGDELTTDASRHPWGHANVWPMAVDPTKPRGGAPPVRDRSPLDVMSELRRGLGQDFVFQVNHPRSGLTGYFDQLGFDPAKGVGTDPGYDPAFDALEVWNGRFVAPRERIVDDWRALLRTGHVVTPVADTDTHGIVGQEAGYPRTYVRVKDDSHLEAWDASRTRDLVAGVKSIRDVVLTNGPMLRVSMNDAPIGGVARGPHVRVKVHVECAPWVEVDRVTLARASDGPVAARAVKLSSLPSGAVAADVSFQVDVHADDALFVTASGSRPMTPALSGDPAEIQPFAMTGAVWVDADHDGKALGR